MSSIVVFGVRTCSRCRWRVQHRTDHYTCHSAAIIAPIKFLVISLRSSWNDLPVGESPALIGAATRPYTPPKFSASTHHAPRATPAVQSSSWRHPWRHLLHVSPSCVSICHLMTSAPCHLGDVICWPLTVDFDWLLTFSVQVLLTQFFA